MKRSRFALSLILGAMTILALGDGIPPVEQGVAADFFDYSCDPLCPGDFRRVPDRYSWFDRHVSAPATTVTVSRIETDDAGYFGLVADAHQITSVYRLLLDHFAWAGDVVEREWDLSPGFDYGAVAVDEIAESVPADVALDWSGMPALNWHNECDICPSYDVLSGALADAPATVGDLSNLVAEWRCSEMDDAAEINAANEGVAPEVAASADAEEAVDGGAAYEQLSLEAGPMADQWLSEIAEQAAQQAVLAVTSRLLLGGPLETESFDLLAEGPRGVCPLLAGEAGEPDAPSHPQRTDIGWYATQSPAADNGPRLAAGPLPAEQPADPAAAARFSEALAGALANAARALDAVSAGLQRVSEHASCMERSAAQSAKRPAPPREEAGDVPTSDIIYQEI
ncbi:MAG: hypothetical protein K1X71_08680 [Pirellulales bacterium]|nr:hypothetical protein [Pirellulales bacterium]